MNTYISPEEIKNLIAHLKTPQAKKAIDDAVQKADRINAELEKARYVNLQELDEPISSPPYNN